MSVEPPSLIKQRFKASQSNEEVDADYGPSFIDDVPAQEDGSLEVDISEAVPNSRRYMSLVSHSLVSPAVPD